MNTNEEAQQPEAYEPADFGDRFLARIADSFLFFAIGCGVAMVPAVVLVFPAASSLDGAKAAGVVAVFLMVPAFVAAVRYEVARTSRRGYSTGKGPTVQVIRWEEYQNPTGVDKYPDMNHSWKRWAVPNGTAIAVVIVLMILSPSSEAGDAFHVLGPSFVVWMSVYMSALFDRDRRGWHDKAAGTVVVKAPRPGVLVDDSERRDTATSTSTGGFVSWFMGRPKTDPESRGDHD